MRLFYAAMVAGFRHGLCRGVGAFFCLALTASGVFAQAAPNWGPSSGVGATYYGNTVTFTAPAANSGSYKFPAAANGNSYNITGTSSGAVVNASKSVAVGSRSFAVNVAKSVPWANVAKGVASVVRVTPQSIIAGAAAAWLIDQGIRWVNCNGGSQCDGAAQWQVKQDTKGTSTQHDYSWSGSGLWRGTADEVVSADVRPYFEASFAKNSTGQKWCNSSGCFSVDAVWRDWKCADALCSTVWIDKRSEASVVSGKGPWDNPTVVTLTTRAKQIPVAADSWQNAPPPDFDKKPPVAPSPDKAPGVWGDALPGGIPDSGAAPQVSGPSTVPGESSSSSVKRPGFRGGQLV